MPFAYHVEFDMDPGHMPLMEVGSEFEIIAATLKSVLPSDMGHVSSRTLYSLDRADMVHIIMESIWETWDDLVNHRDSDHDEFKYLSEWAPDLAHGVEVHVYGQAGDLTLPKLEVRREEAWPWIAPSLAPSWA